MNIYGSNIYYPYQTNQQNNNSQNSTNNWSNNQSSSNSYLNGIYNQTNNILGIGSSKIDFNQLDEIINSILYPPVDPEEQAKLELRKEIQTQWDRFSDQKDAFLANEANLSPEEFKSRLNAINQMEKGYMIALKNSYPEDSIQAKAVDSLIKVTEAEQLLFTLNEEIDNISDTVTELEAQLAKLEPNNTQAQQLQLRIESLNKIIEGLNEKKDETEETYRQEQKNFVSNTMNCPRKDRKMIADFRSDQFHSQSVLHQSRTETLSERIDAIEERLENPNLPADYRETLELKLQLAQQDLKEERSGLRTSKFNEFLMNILKGF